MAQAAPLGGVFALDLDQTETDNIRGLAPQWVRVGAAWRWDGVPVRLDGPTQVIPLRPGPGGRDIKDRARNVAQRISGTVAPPQGPDPQISVPSDGIALTDGYHAYIARFIRTARGSQIVFEGSLPPYGQTCWVTSVNLAPAQPVPADDGVICFANDTMIATPSGDVPISQLGAGDLVLTRDNGPQPVLWLGKTTLSGLAFRRHPHLRPIRLRRGALQDGRPCDDLCVSPQHRVLVEGAQARDLFGAPEVLVEATDLVDYKTVLPDLALHGVTYMHLLLEAHQVIYANGLPSESFHPASAAASTLRLHAHALRRISDHLVHAPERYGPTARRYLSRGEAALLAA